MSNELQSLEFDSIKGYAVQKNGVLWLHANGETWTVETASRSGRRGSKAAASSANPGEIAAPMPGKIIKVAAPQGTKVTKGSVVIVMEAMKMEYTLKAPADGVISEIRCAAGDQVPLGQLLARLKVDGAKA